MQLSKAFDAVWIVLGPLCLALFLFWADRGLASLRGKAARNERRRTTAMFLNALGIAFVVAGLANSFLAIDFFALIALKAGTDFERVIATWAAVLIGVVLHLLARMTLNGVED
ncbi:hypothetical protein [Methylobacterium oxalidis]|uniref:Uncharacterized protein n=1 Tax=Methylobacterium oxalidis TaxID=944322 RepID=A0ABQ6DN61_9HYPH|nr:hypothetical protein [Methylobacterium oxalidis]GJE35638.1 hypothetical protein LDDCCGHA_5858 [Methylobacterium oxalidis]GLS65552.1 hypothetical protein GCM10007888_39340 [Methylobacterium oxalidis]